MKKLHSLLALILLLFTASGCEDDYRSIVLFEGVEPIYQIGTCDNLVSSLTLYLTNPDGIVLGIDGGDGNYSLSGVDAAVATVEFTDDVNGYRRIRIVPKKEGVANVVVKDGSGGATMLKLEVKDCYKYYYHVQDVGYIHTGEIDDSAWKAIVSGLEQRMAMKKQGYYTLIPADPESSVWRSGELRVKADDLSQGFMKGTFEMVKQESIGAVLRFSYNDEVHDFYFNNPLAQSSTRESKIAPFVMYEDVTSYSPIALPAGCEVYRLERWLRIFDMNLYADDTM